MHQALNVLGWIWGLAGTLAIAFMALGFWTIAHDPSTARLPARSSEPVLLPDVAEPDDAEYVATIQRLRALEEAALRRLRELRDGQP